MHSWKLASGLAFAVIVAACSPTAVPTGEASASAGLPQTSAAATTPSLPPTKAQLAAAYLACANPSNKTLDALQKRLKKATTLKAAKAVLRDYAAADGTFATCVRAIDWTAEYEADVRDLLKALSAIQVTERAMGHAGTIAEYNSYYSTWNKQGLRETSAANQLRGDLGLPPPPA